MNVEFNSLPVSAPLRITSKYGKRSTGITNASTFHKGVDLGRDWSKNETEVLAGKDGTVAANYWSNYRGTIGGA